MAFDNKVSYFLNKYLVRIKSIYAPDEMWLWGSRVYGTPNEYSDIDLIVVPGVAFDMSGNRLGMGKGFYDRALKDVGKGKIAALAYEFQLIGKVPVYGHDVGVGWIITEERILDVINNNG